MRKIILMLFFLSVAGASESQNIKQRNNTIFAEGLGSGGYGSLNYEHAIFKKNDLTVAARFGIGTYNFFDFTNRFNPDVILPITVSTFYGKNHHVEFGIGQTVTSIVQANSDFHPERENSFNGTFFMGYRYQKQMGGISFRILYSPIIEKNKYFRHWGAISVGYVF
ncbi:MAG: hypothetical protein J7L46_03435 [Bacteroidales bacterium]|nr:hypothetical protein [Bacteroidales bacterium]